MKSLPVVQPPARRLVRYAEEHAPISVIELKRVMASWDKEYGSGRYSKYTVQSQVNRLTRMCRRVEDYPLVLRSGVIYLRDNPNGEDTRIPFPPQHPDTKAGAEDEVVGAESHAIYDDTMRPSVSVIIAKVLRMAEECGGLAELADICNHLVAVSQAP